MSALYCNDAWLQSYALRGKYVLMFSYNKKIFVANFIP
jgi:hypothetical protein